MGTSIYVFKNLKTYLKSYENFVDPKKDLNERSIKVRDLYTRPNEKLWFVLDTDKFSNKISITKSITFLTLKDFKFSSDGKEKLVKYGRLKFDFKHNKLIFNPRFLRKPDLILKTDKYVSMLNEKPKKTKKIDNSCMFFDLQFNRLCLVLENEI